MKLPRRAHFINCVRGSIDRHAVGHRVELSPSWWITRRDSAPYPSALTKSPRFSGWFMNGYRPTCGSVDAGSLKGGRRLRIKGRSWKVAAPGGWGGGLTIFTSIALRGWHFEGTSSLKTMGLDFHVRQNLFAPLSNRFYVASVSSVRLSGEHSLQRWVCKWRKELCFETSTEMFGSGWCALRHLSWRIVSFVRCGSKIEEPSGERGSASARCSRSGRTSPLPTSCLYWPGQRTMHR